MIASIVTTMGIFSVSCILHVITHRALVTHGIRTIKSALVYGGGLLVLLSLCFTGGVSLPITSILLYALSSFLVSWFSLAPYLGGETPTSMILDSYATKTSQTEKDLQKLFTERGLVGKRLNDLVTSGMVVQKNTKFSVSSKGKIAVKAIMFYQKVFNRTMSG